MNFNFPAKLLLAAASGFLVAVTFNSGPSDDTWTGWIVQYVISGSLFAFGVLWPYLKQDRQIFVRGAGLIASSVLSYWCAVQTVLEWPPSFSSDFRISAFVVASAAGAAIVLTGLKLLIPMKLSAKLLIYGTAAAVLGGFTMYAALELDGVWFYLLGHPMWHIIIGSAIHYATRAAPQQLPGQAHTV